MKINPRDLIKVNVIMADIDEAIAGRCFSTDSTFYT